MSLVTASAAPSASPSSCATADFTRFPTTDIACAVGSVTGIPSNTSSILSSCCKSAPVEQFNGDCGYYCLSVDQSVGDLTACFQKEGIKPATIFCSGNNTATATGKPTSTGSPTASGSRGSGTSSTGAAFTLLASQGLSKTGLCMLSMVVVSALTGALL